MLKLDSIRNTAYLGALIRVKNVEELEYLKVNLLLMLKLVIQK